MVGKQLRIAASPTDPGAQGASAAPTLEQECQGLLEQLDTQTQNTCMAVIHNRHARNDLVRRTLWANTVLHGVFHRFELRHTQLKTQHSKLKTPALSHARPAAPPPPPPAPPHADRRCAGL